MSINEMDAKAAEYFALQEQIEQLQAEAEAIITGLPHKIKMEEQRT